MWSLLLCLCTSELAIGEHRNEQTEPGFSQHRQESCGLWSFALEEIVVHLLIWSFTVRHNVRIWFVLFIRNGCWLTTDVFFCIYWADPTGIPFHCVTVLMYKVKATLHLWTHSTFSHFWGGEHLVPTGCYKAYESTGSGPAKSHGQNSKLVDL